MEMWISPRETAPSYIASDGRLRRIWQRLSERATSAASSATRARVAFREWALGPDAGLTAESDRFGHRRTSDVYDQTKAEIGARRGRAHTASGRPLPSGEEGELHVIRTMPPNGIFVFGSNEKGVHGAGAARTAASLFGAEFGVGEGPTGRCYAIPTKDRQLRVRSLDEIRISVGAFLEYARRESGLDFFVTRVGCGLAGFHDADIAPLFRGAPSNCHFPSEWSSWLEPPVSSSSP